MNFRVLSLIFLCVLNSFNFANGQEGQNLKVQGWWSSEYRPESKIWYTDPPKPDEIRYRLTPQKGISWEKGKKEDGIVFQIDPNKSYQSMLGIGTSLEATSIYAIRKNKTEDEIRAFIRMLLDPGEGMGFNIFRVCIGTSDFSDGRSVSEHPQGYYTYQDERKASFSIQNDVELNIIQTLKMVIEEADKLDLPGGIRFFASIWSPPAWMKTSNSLIGGTLKEGYESELARYFRSFIEAYDAQGIPIYAITVQNEPNFVPKTYPGMRLSPEQERGIVEATFREFNGTNERENVISTKIWINDHNMNHWKNADKVLEQLDQKGAKNMVDGVAFHNYNPRVPVSNMSRLHDLHPNVDIHLTEHAEWGVKGMYNIQQYFMNWSRTYAYWVPATTIDLDEHNQGPYNKLGDLSPTIFIKDGASEMYVTPEYYLISQFSRFIRPGAKRIEVNPGEAANLTSVAFKNPNGSTILVLVNQTGEDQKFISQIDDHYFEHLIPAKSVGTYVW